jgi:superfamily II DNA or RNA helicase
MARVYKFFDNPKATQPIFTYGLKEAVSDGVLSKVNQQNYFVGLHYLEWFGWLKCADNITKHKESIMYNNVLELDEDRVRNGDIVYLEDKLEDVKRELENRKFEQSGFHRHDQRQNKLSLLREAIEGLLHEYISRRRILNMARHKWDAVRYLFGESNIKDALRNGKWVFFHQEVEECHRTTKMLKEIVGENQVAEHHSQILMQQRNAALEALNRGEVRYLCAVKTLDEGVNVPTLDGAVIVSGSASRLQQVQRCGRALRRATGKEVAYLVFLLVKGDNDKLGVERPVFDDERTCRNWQKSDIELPFPRFGEFDI